MNAIHDIDALNMVRSVLSRRPRPRDDQPHVALLFQARPRQDASPVALADPKVGEREVLAAMLDVEPQLATARPAWS